VEELKNRAADICGCSKICHPTERAALMHARGLRRYRGERFARPYKCSEADVWHVTSQPEQRSYEDKLADYMRIGRRG